MNIKHNEIIFFLSYEKFKTIYPKANNSNIYFFKSNDNSYIFFKNDNQIFKIENYLNFGLYTISDYKYNKSNILEYIYQEIENNKNPKKLELNSENDWEDFYLIDNKWATPKINNYNNNYNNCRIEPKSNKLNEFEYRINFGILKKEKFKKIINDLNEENKDIKNILISKIIFLNWVNSNFNQENHTYIVTNNNNENYCCFYLMTPKEEYLFQFILEFKKPENIILEIELMKYRGIGNYLNEKGIQTNYNIKNQLYLYNKKLENIGTFIASSKIKVFPISEHKHSKGLKLIEDINCETHPNQKVNLICRMEKKNKLICQNCHDHQICEKDCSGKHYKLLKYYNNVKLVNGIIYCLINIKEIKDFYSNIFEIIEMSQILGDDMIFTKYLYQIMNELWISDDEENESDTIMNINRGILEKNYLQFKNIFSKLKSLVAYLLKRLHYESVLCSYKKEKKDSRKFNIIYNNNTREWFIPPGNDIKSIDEIEKIISEEPSIIQKSFSLIYNFFISCEECKKKERERKVNSFFWDVFLEVDYKEIAKYLKEDKKKRKILDIYDILNVLNEYITYCSVCGKKVNPKRKICKVYQYLIIIISKENSNYNDGYKFIINDNIDLSDYYNDTSLLIKPKHPYELISFLINENIAYCKSPVDNEWYKYENGNPHKINSKIQEIKVNEVPILFIFKKGK